MHVLSVSGGTPTTSTDTPTRMNSKSFCDKFAKSLPFVLSIRTATQVVPQVWRSFPMKNRFTIFPTIIFLSALLLGMSEVSGQNCIALGGANPSTHTQNFDGLGNSPAPQNGDAANIFQLNASAPRRYLGKFDNAVADSSVVVNVPGWAVVEEGTNVSSVTGRYAAGDGSTAGGNTFSFASAAANTDRAFGSLTDDTVSTNFLGGCFRNTTGTTASAVSIAFTGEMWRLGGSGAPDRLDFQYAVNATNTYAGSYFDFNALDFITPSLAGSAGLRDGNAAANRTVFPATNILVTLAPNETLHVRWVDSNIAGADDGLAIDDFSIQILVVSAANASINGRVVTSTGRGVFGAHVSVADANGNVKTSITNPFGYYGFEDLPAGQTYAVTVRSKRYQFGESTRIVTLKDNMTDFEFVALP